jgi:hypothetical protein
MFAQPFRLIFTLENTADKMVGSLVQEAAEVEGG